MRYLKIFEQISDKARIAVSNFILGKSIVTNLSPITYENKHSLDNIVAMLEKLKEKL